MWTAHYFESCDAWSHAHDWRESTVVFVCQRQVTTLLRKRKYLEREVKNKPLKLLLEIIFGPSYFWHSVFDPHYGNGIKLWKVIHRTVTWILQRGRFTENIFIEHFIHTVLCVYRVWMMLSLNYITTVIVFLFLFSICTTDFWPAVLHYCEWMPAKMLCSQPVPQNISEWKSYNRIISIKCHTKRKIPCWSESYHHIWPPSI